MSSGVFNVGLNNFTSSLVLSNSNSSLVISKGGTINLDFSQTGPAAPGNSSQSGVTDGDKGDITVSSSGEQWIIDARSITPAKLFEVGPYKLVGRYNGSSGDAQEVGIGGGIEFDASGIRRSALTGDVTAAAGSGATTITPASNPEWITAIAWSKVTGTPTSLSGYGITDSVVPQTRTISAGTGMAGGGDLTTNRTFSVVYGTTAGTSCEGNDARLSDARTPTSHTHPASQISDSTAAGRAILTAADAAAQRTNLSLGGAALLNVGTTAGTVAAGNDARLSDARPPTAHTHTASEISDATSAGRAILTAADAAAQRTALGLGTVATQNANNITLTGGTLQGVGVVTGSYTSKANEAILRSCRKASAGTITKGQVVYIVGSTGVHLTVELSDADTESESSKTFGVAAETITNSVEGYVMVEGLLTGLSNLPSTSFADGDALWLSPTTGGWQNTPPANPAHGVYLGRVIKASNGSNAEAYIRIQNGYELNELHDVVITTPLDTHSLFYETSSGLWKNRKPALSDISQSSATTGQFSEWNGSSWVPASIVAADITDSTAAGRSMLTAADASAQRTSLGLGGAAVLNVGTTAGTVAAGDDARLSDARTPTAHTHTASQISDSTAAGRSLLTGVDAAAQRTSLGLGGAAVLNVGTAAGTVAAGDHTHTWSAILSTPTTVAGYGITDAVPQTRTLTAGSGLSGGGDLSANRTFSVSYGTTSGTSCQGNDSRLSDARTPTAHQTSHRLGGSDVITPIAQSMGDTDATVSAGVTYVRTSASFTAPRTLTLPAASTVPAGLSIVVLDTFGAVNGANTLTIARAGSDTVNGVTTAVIGTARGGRMLTSDGVSAWTFDNDVLRTSQNLSDVANAATARANLGIGSAAVRADTDFVRFDVDQSATATQKRTARRNIGFSDSFTTAELLALGATESAKLRVAFCSDCLTSGATTTSLVGDVCLWEGDRWLTLYDRVQPNTDWLTFALEIVRRGDGPRMGPFLSVHGDSAQNVAGVSGYVSGTGATFVGFSSQATGLVQITCGPGTTSTGSFKAVPVFAVNSMVTTNPVRKMALVLNYQASTSAVSTSGVDELHWRVGFQNPVFNSTATLQNDDFGFVMDDINTLGQGASGANFRAMCRLNATTTDWVDTGLSVSAANCFLIISWEPNGPGVREGRVRLASAGDFGASVVTHVDRTGSFSTAITQFMPCINGAKTRGTGTKLISRRYLQCVTLRTSAGSGGIIS